MQKTAYYSDSAYVEQAKKTEQPIAAAVENTSARGFFWFVAQGSLLKGPYSTTELKKLIDQKEIGEKFFAWRDGYREWRPLYGIEEFKLEKNTEAFYPSVPVPGVHVPAPLSSDTSETSHHHSQKNMAVYKVRFSRSRWSDLKKSEIFGFFLISLSFTFAVLYLSFTTFEKEWQQVWGRRSSAMLYSVGSNFEALPLYMIDPLLSAPGLEHQAEHWIAVEQEANMDRYDPAKVAGIIFDDGMPMASKENLAWDKSNTYSRRILVRGALNIVAPTAEKVIRVETQGLPYEPVFSPRLADHLSNRLSEGSAHP